MSGINHGSQDLSYTYYENLAAEDVNKRNIDIVPRGIYSGAHFTKVSNTEVTLSPFAIEIGDDDVQICSKSSANATLNSTTLDSGNIASATPYLVFRWAYDDEENNYVEIHAIDSLSSAQDNDIIIGKCDFSGATLNGFIYTDRTLLNVSNVFLRVEETETSEMYVWVRQGRVQGSSQYYTIAEQKVGLFVAPSAPNSRIDLVYINTNGTVAIQQGTAAVSPTAPAYGSKMVLAEVTVVNGVSNITQDNIKDVRTPFRFPYSLTTIYGDRTYQDSLGATLLGNTSSGNTNRYLAQNDGKLIVKHYSTLPDMQIYVKFVGAGSYTQLYNEDQNAGNYISAEISIKKNELFYVTTSRSSATFTIYWMPIGSGSLVKQ